jgi:hypothetical protein
MRRLDDEFTRSSSSNPSPPLSGGSSGRPPHEPPNAFDREFLETFARREPAPATPEADNAGPWRVTRLHGAGEPRWGCVAAGEPPPRFQLREPDVAFLTSAGLALADRPTRFRFLRNAAGTLHLMQDGHSVGTVAASAPQSDQLLVILTALHHLRVQPEALAHFLLAVPDGVLRRCGVVLAAMAGEGG